MGLFGNMFKDESKSAANPSISLNTSKAPSLNLEKDGILNLEKVRSDLKNLRLAAGWDMVHFGSDYDLDLCAYLLGENGFPIRSGNSCVYYAKKKACGLRLDKDNLTGEGDGDDENIYIHLDDVTNEVQKIVFAVVIYNAGRKSFEGVKNAYVRLLDTDDGDREICRYDLTRDGGNHTAVVVAELYRENGSWSFKARGEYMNETISSLKNKVH
ncbi:MAG: TerD family protein [Blautia hansenii]|jgi:Uncharacterized proteins involved in stress response, homologs of TerZ and putative cAMP-binding protein CABP1